MSTPIASAAQIFSVFDAGSSPSVDDMVGRWRGTGICTGHFLDGMLEAYGWYGKEFASADIVHPLLFGRRNPVAVNPRFLPLNTLTANLQRLSLMRLAFRSCYRILRTTRAKARLREITYRGVPTLAMIYDHQPIIDYFRVVESGVLLGCMEHRDTEPFFFLLRRELCS